MHPKERNLDNISSRWNPSTGMFRNNTLCTVADDATNANETIMDETLDHSGDGADLPAHNDSDPTRGFDLQRGSTQQSDSKQPPQKVSDGTTDGERAANSAGTND